MPRKLMFCLLTWALLGPAAPAPSAAQTPAQQPQWKDREEYDLFNSILKETDPKKRLQLLDQWRDKYKDTAFKEVRLKTYMQTYQQAGQAAKAVEAANEVLAMTPEDFSACYMIASLTPFLGSNDPAVWANGEKAANCVLKKVDEQFAADKKPANVSDAEWANLKKQALFLAHQCLGWVAKAQKKNDVAEQEFLKALDLNSTAAVVSYWLGEAVREEKNPEKTTLVLFSFARAAAYDGPGALTPSGRQSIDAYLAKVYKSFHGDDPQGLAELKKLARERPLPPAGYKIKSSDEVAAQKEEELRKTNPLLATFLTIKENLTGSDSASFWKQMEGHAMPPLRGTVVTAKPAVKPKVVELAMSQSTTAEITLTAPETPARCKLEPGDVVEFVGSEAKEFTASPFRIKMEGGKITSGCKEAPAPAKKAVPKRAGAKKKAG